MIKWTTPTLECTLPNLGIFDYLLITFVTPQVRIEKRINYEDTEVIDDLITFTVTFTQEETGQFAIGVNVAAQCNVVVGNKRLGTNEELLHVARNLKNEAIEL